MDRTSRFLLAVIAACLLWISLRISLPEAKSQAGRFMIATGHGTIVWRVDATSGAIERCVFGFGCEVAAAP